MMARLMRYVWLSWLAWIAFGVRVAHIRSKQIDSRKKAALDRYFVGAPLAGALYAKTKIKRDGEISKSAGITISRRRSTIGLSIIAARVAPTSTI